MNRAMILAIVSLAGCTTYKLWNEADSDQGAGTVQLSYEYRKFESPQVDERAGTEMARERCRDWGYTSAHRSGEDRKCASGSESGSGSEKNCSKWVVTREYRCTK
jgi:hypothetical protein